MRLTAFGSKHFYQSELVNVNQSLWVQNDLLQETMKGLSQGGQIDGSRTASHISGERYSLDNVRDHEVILLAAWAALPAARFSAARSRTSCQSVLGRLVRSLSERAEGVLLRKLPSAAGVRPLPYVR